jgi:hypothetical protein
MRIILKWIFKTWDVEWGVNWIDLAQKSGRWRYLVKTLINLQFPYSAETFLTSGESLSFSRKTLLLGVSELVRVTINIGCFSPVVGLC